MKRLLKGMPVRLAILDFGMLQVTETGRNIGISGYLIQTSEGENVLIDSGFPAHYARDTDTAAAQDGLVDFGHILSLTQDNLAPAQLALLGVAPEDIDLMIQSHTHIDNIGFMHAFPGTPIVIAAAERALPRPITWPGAPVIEWPEATYVTLDGDTVLGPGFQALLVPGHTPGQMAFALHLPEKGAILLTSDAISCPAELDTGFSGAWDPDLAVTQARRLLQRAVSERATIIYGHCPDQWPDLRKAPSFYD